MKPSGSLFLNLGDTYFRRSLVGIPHLVEAAAREDGWRVRNRIIWSKPNGVPAPHKDRLANRHEVLLHLTGSQRYYYDLVGFCEYLGVRSPGGDVWEIKPSRHIGEHAATFPLELAKRVISLACPIQVCRRCGLPRLRCVERSMDLDTSRQQARRALQLVREHGLTADHLAAIRATGIADAGKGARLQDITGKNRQHIHILATEAKTVLRGYFREFTFARPLTVGFTRCSCAKGWTPGLTLDVFAGTCTTLLAARQLGRHSIGVDLKRWTEDPKPTRKDVLA